MYKRKIGLAVGILVLAGFFFGLQQPAFSSGKQINWYTYEEGIDRARRQNKNMVIYFHAEWCAYCTQMEKETFTDAFVVIHKDKIVYESYLNGMNADHPHQMMSCTKSFAGLFALLAVDEGQMNESDLITDILPELKTGGAFDGATVNMH